MIEIRSKIQQLPCIRGLARARDLVIGIRNHKRSLEVPEQDRTFQVNYEETSQSRRHSVNEQLIARTKDLLRLMDSFQGEPLQTQPEQPPQAPTSSPLESLQTEIDNLCESNVRLSTDNQQLQETCMALLQHLFQHRQAIREVQKQYSLVKILEQNVRAVRSQLQATQGIGTGREQAVSKAVGGVKAGVVQAIEQDTWALKCIGQKEQRIRAMRARLQGSGRPIKSVLRPQKIGEFEFM